MLSLGEIDHHPRSFPAGTKWIAAALTAALVPAPFVVLGAVSLVMRRPYLGPLTRSMGRPSMASAARLTAWWTAGMAVVTVGQAAGAAAGAMDILKPSGLVAHSLFGLAIVAVLLTGTAASLRRPQRAGRRGP